MSEVEEWQLVFNTYSASGSLPVEASHTASFLYRMDKLFNLFNSSQQQHCIARAGSFNLNHAHAVVLDSICKYL